MLLGFSGHLNAQYSARDSIHNYYEQLVIDQLLRSNDRVLNDPDFLADVTCVALNRLPPRYIRHDVDMTFFLSPKEMEEMTDKVVHAVNEAIGYVEEREAQRLAETSLAEGAEAPTKESTATEKRSKKKAKTKKSP